MLDKTSARDWRDRLQRLWAERIPLAGATTDVSVVVAEAGMRFISPVTGELVANAVWPSAEDAAAFRRGLAERGRARLRIQVEIAGRGGASAATFSGEFVARRAPPG
jgi:thioesterase domain-containing protein